MASLRYSEPTQIQAKAFPIALQGNDLVGIAQTGTGKTLAFAIPMIQRLATEKGCGLVIAPTRELALQIDETFQKLGRPIGLRTAVLIGGTPAGAQIQQLRRNPHVIIVTPGRCIDHIQRRTIDLSRVSILVLDEADRMLDMGFEPQIRQILHVVPSTRQTMLFSATMPNQIVRMASTYMRAPVRVEIARAGTMAENVSQEAFIVKKSDKTRLLEKILSEPYKTILIFSRTKYGAKKIARSVRAMGSTASEIHSNRSLSQRRLALDGFKSGEYRVLVATDIASRGIDVTGIDLVINFDLPDVAEDYVHRIGRTGRASMSGHAISFVTPEQRNEMRDIERLTRKALPVSALPTLPPFRAEEPAMDESRRPFSRPPRRNGREQSRSPFQPQRQGQPSRRPSHQGGRHFQSHSNHR